MGYVGVVAVNQALGGSLYDFTPAIRYFKALAKNEPIAPRGTLCVDPRRDLRRGATLRRFNAIVGPL